MHSDTLMAGSAPTLGRTLKGKFRIDGELGGGAMGVVFRGTNVELGKPVAIKMLRMDGFGSRDAQERFEREARMASKLSHPGIAHVFDYGIEDGLPFLVMELVDGKELADVITEEGPMPPARAVAIMRQLASALEEAHAHGVVHRDIKPQNLKLMRYTPGGQIYLKVLDFGIAKQVGGEHGKLTATGAVLGTPMYMAPEQAGGSSSKVDGRADQYAAGIVLYEMLTGQVPFTGDSLAGVLVSHLTQAPPQLPKSMPEPLRQIVERLLRKHPDERFADCGALDRALQACEGACRDVPPLLQGSVQPVVSLGVRQRTGSFGTTLGFGLGALAVAGVTMFAVATYGPRLRHAPPPDKVPPVSTSGGPAPATVTPPPVAPPARVEGPPQRHADSGKPAPPDRPARGPRRSHKGGEVEAAPPPERPGPGLSSAEAQAKLEEAEKLFQQKQYTEAIQVARQSVGIENSGRAWRLITLAYCNMGSLEMAKASFHRVSAGDKRQLIERCRKFDIDLVD